jgi:hypothetical protein
MASSPQASSPSATAVTSGMDDAVIYELQRRLTKPGAKVQVNREHVAVAVRLARDPALVVGTVCKAAGIAKGKATLHIAEWRKQIVAGDLLGVCAASVLQDIGPTAAPSAFGLPGQLLVQPNWIAEHLHGLRDIVSGPLVRCDNGTHATRSITAYSEYVDEQVRGEVKYDLAPAGESDEDSRLRAAKHRGREEAALRALDGVAAAEHRTKKSKLQHDMREQQRTSEDCVLRGVVDRLISQLERKAHLAELSRRLPLHGWSPGRAFVHIGDLVYIRPVFLPGDGWTEGTTASGDRFFEDSITGERIYPDYPPPFQLAVLRKVRSRGRTVDLQLCQLSLPAMGDVCEVDRILLDGWMRGVDASTILAPVLPANSRRAQNDYRTWRRDADGQLVYPREFWAPHQLWHAAKYAMDNCATATARKWREAQSRNFRGECGEAFVPRLSTLAMDALPDFLAAESNGRGPSAQWKRSITSFKREEIDRARSRSSAIFELEQKECGGLD